MWWTEGDLWLPEAQRSELTYCVLSMRVCSHSTCGVRQASYVAYFCMFFTYEPCIVFSPRQDVSVGACWVSMCAHMHFCRNVSLCSLFFFLVYVCQRVYRLFLSGGFSDTAGRSASQPLPLTLNPNEGCFYLFLLIYSSVFRFSLAGKEDFMH